MRKRPTAHVTDMPSSRIGCVVCGRRCRRASDWVCTKHWRGLSDDLQFRVAETDGVDDPAEVEAAMVAVLDWYGAELAHTLTDMMDQSGEATP